ncbi:MAG: stage V sporulation protein AD [Clostridia bacterium]|nr:stage V sporulation protein AD [Clostridia bacterium]
MGTRCGRQTVALSTKPTIYAFTSIAGKKEGEGPLGNQFDMVFEDAFLGEETWEKAEMRLYEKCFSQILQKGSLSPSDIDYIISGDLLNQCTSSAFGMKDSSIPYLGIYGACSTMAESISLAAMLSDGGFSAGNILSMAGSHFCSAEKQFRAPLEYGGQRPPSAQWTVTGAGAVCISHGGPIEITHITTGKITDLGIKDANNMGAAMAPAFVSTLTAHLKETGREPCFYDLIVSGDLGLIGKEIALELTGKEGFDISSNYNDCGAMIFDPQKQDTHAGGSGCGCSACVLCGYILPEMIKGTFKNVLFIATGALMSPTTTQQGESIPSIAHAVALSKLQ